MKASDFSTVVEHLPHNPKAKVLSTAIDDGTRREKKTKKSIEIFLCSTIKK
jgi:hypothetical protein